MTATPKVESPVVNTVFSFVDREASKPTANATGFKYIDSNILIKSKAVTL